MITGMSNRVSAIFSMLVFAMLVLSSASAVSEHLQAGKYKGHRNLSFGGRADFNFNVDYELGPLRIHVGGDQVDNPVLTDSVLTFLWDGHHCLLTKKKDLNGLSLAGSCCDALLPCCAAGQPSAACQDFELIVPGMGFVETASPLEADPIGGDAAETEAISSGESPSADAQPSEQDLAATEPESTAGGDGDPP